MSLNTNQDFEEELDALDRELLQDPKTKQYQQRVLLFLSAILAFQLISLIVEAVKISYVSNLVSDLDIDGIKQSINGLQSIDTKELGEVISDVRALRRSIDADDIGDFVNTTSRYLHDLKQCTRSLCHN